MNLRIVLHSCLVGALMGVSIHAQAISVGVPPGNGPITNPFTGKQTEVWKLAGTTACSSFQISRDWVASSYHCRLENGAVFSNLLALPGTNGSTVTDCLYGSQTPPPGYVIGVANDFTVCRLVSPGNFTQLPSYPPLTLRPNFSRSNASKLGQLLGFGYGNLVLGHGNALVNFVDFAGMPYGFDAALDPSLATVPKTVDLDSSGALFWFSPVQGKPAFVGVLATEGYINWSAAGYFSAANLQAIANHVASTNCAMPACMPPTIVATSDHYDGSAIDPAADLPSAPTVSGVHPALTLSWPASPPVAGGGDVSYDVTVGLNGAKQANFSPVGVTVTSVALNALPAGFLHVCVVPRNVNGGRANSGYADSRNSVLKPNCTSIDNRLPDPVSSVSLPVSASTSSSFRRVAVNWSPVNSATVAPSVKFEVLRSVRLPGASTTRNTLLTTSATSVAGVDVVRGSTVCAKVTSISALSQRGSSVTQCVVAN